MPEYREVLANVYTVQRWLQDVYRPNQDSALCLQALWVDSTNSEQKNAKSRSSQEAQGLTYRLNSGSTIQRGSSGSQQPVWPHKDGHPVQSLDGMVLSSIKATPRMVVINLETIVLQVRLHTHVVSQVYTRSQWYDEIAMVPKVTRVFRVAIALDFGNWVVAFLSADNIWTPYWSQPSDPLPVYHPDVYHDYPAFVGYMANAIWDCLGPLKPNRGKKEDTEKLALNWVRENVGGVGMYMSEEIFYLAGLSPFISEYEFFSCPSRVARFCEAFWTLAEHAHKALSTLLEPCYEGYVLAPTEGHRLRYTRWLYVHAKKQVVMSLRMKSLRNNYLAVLSTDNQHNDSDRPRQVRSSSCGLYDVFEPTYIKPALEKPGFSLARYIFEPTTVPASVQVGPEDPLMEVYHELVATGLLPRTPLSTNLKPAHYSPICLAESDMNAARINTSLWLCKSVISQKPVWSILPPFPAHLVERSHHLDMPLSLLPSRRLFEHADDNARNVQSFQYIVSNSKKVAIGPLEYCAIGRRLYRGGCGKEKPQ
ncbi:hypothetical protein C8Q78DRAFT_1046844 [Trametes maxima]|nr:hypothetical protein C8Q78DRAFT_1046844 [Trametes maxima]